MNKTCAICGKALVGNHDLCCGCRKEWAKEILTAEPWITETIKAHRKTQRKEAYDNQNHPAVSLDALAEFENPCLAVDPNIEFEEWLWEMAR